VCANALGEVRAAIGTEVHAVVDEVRSQLGLSVALGACGTLGNRVVEAMPEEKCSFFWAHSTRPPAVQMNNMIAVKREGVVHGNRPLAPPALRLSPLFHQRRCYRPHYQQRRRHPIRSRHSDTMRTTEARGRQNTEPSPSSHGHHTNSSPGGRRRCAGRPLPRHGK